MIKTLIIQPLPGIGDMVWHIRALKAISTANAGHQVTILARSSSQAKSLLHNESWVDDVIYLEEQHQSFLGSYYLSRDLRPRGFDQVWILHHSAKYYIASKFAGIIKRGGYGFGWTKGLLTSSRYLNSCDQHLHPIQKYEKLLGLLDIDVSAYNNHLSVSDLYKDAIKQEYGHLPRPWIALGIGATAASRIWPAHRFAELVTQLLQSTGGTVFLCCAPHEAPLAQTIKYSVNNQGFTVTIVKPQHLEITMALLSLSTCFIGNDSGLLNVSGSLQIPALGIFSALGIQPYDLSLFPQVLHFERNLNDKSIDTITVHDVMKKISEYKILPICL